MKLSFSKSSSSSSKSKLLKPSIDFNDKTLDQEPSDDSKQYVNEFDSSKPLPESKKLVIPLQNEWRPLKKMKNLEIPLNEPNGSDLKFESGSGSDPSDDPNVTYGLNLRQAVKESKIANEPLRTTPLEVVMLEKFKTDINTLPEDNGFEDFKDVPLESFAAALMEGYGWREGKGIGRSSKEDVKVKIYNRRADNQGLGFVSDVPLSHSKKEERNKARDRETERSREGGRVSENRDRGRSREGDGDGLVVGKHVRIVGGRDAGLKGRIVEKLGTDWVVLQLSRSEVKVRVNDVVELGSKEDERFMKKVEELKVRDEKKGQKRGRDVERVVGKYENSMRDGEKRDREKRDREKDGEKRNGRSPWLKSHIRVRIVSKDFKGGKFYLKKGEIVDVVGPSICDISINDSKELVQGVSQDFLETALPKRGGPVLVLYGKHKGVYGNLVDRDLDKETGVVRDADSHELLNVHLEQIAEYVGDPSYLGY